MTTYPVAPVAPVTTAATSTEVAAHALLPAMKAALVASPSRPSVPVLSAVRLSALAGTLSVECFDYEVSVTKRVPAEGDLDPVLVQAKALYDLLKRLDAKGRVTLTLDDAGRLVVSQGSKSSSFKTLEIDDYPALPVAARTAFTVSGKALHTLATSVAPFAGKDDMLPVLTGTQVVFEDGTLTAGTTDRFRAAFYETTAVGTENVKLLTVRLKETTALVATAETVQVGAENGILTLSTDDTVVTSRLLDGDYPRLAQLFVAEHDHRATFDGVTMQKAIGFAAAAAERNTPLHVTFGEGTVVVKGGTSDELSASDTVTAVVEGGETAVFGVNPTYLLDAIKVFGKGDVTTTFGQVTRPCLTTGETIPELRVLLMPLRLQS